jgi:hypothetical protein
VLRRFCVNDQYQCYAFGFNGKTGLPARRVVRITVQQPVPAPSVRSFVLLLAGLASLGFVVSSVVIVAGIVGRVIVGRVIIVAVVISFVFAIFVAVAERR